MEIFGIDFNKDTIGNVVAGNLITEGGKFIATEAYKGVSKYFDKDKSSDDELDLLFSKKSSYKKGYYRVGIIPAPKNRQNVANKPEPLYKNHHFKMTGGGISC